MRATLFLKHVLRKIFLEDWAMKLIALAITLGLWLGVTGLGTRKKERFSTVPLTFRVSNDAEITNAPVQDVSLVLSGDSRRLDEIRSSDLNVSVDLTAVTPADLIVNLDPQSVSVAGLPRGVIVDEIQPLRIPVRLEAVEERDVVVAPVTEGAPAPGYEVYSTIVQPGRVRIHGPKEYVDTLDSLPTDTIELTGKKDDFTAKQIAVLVANPKATALATVVDVQFRIGEKRVERSFTAPISGLAGKTATFTVYGPRTALAKLKPDAFKVEMVLNENGEETPEVTLPPDLQDTADVRKVTVK